jgi:hypothetical protein
MLDVICIFGLVAYRKHRNDSTSLLKKVEAYNFVFIIFYSTGRQYSTENTINQKKAQVIHFSIDPGSFQQIFPKMLSRFLESSIVISYQGIVTGTIFYWYSKHLHLNFNTLNRIDFKKVSEESLAQLKMISKINSRFQKTDILWEDIAKKAAAVNRLKPLFYVLLFLTTAQTLGL